MSERPVPTTTTIMCERCDEVPITLTLNWWKDCDTLEWHQETVNTTSFNDRLCPQCLDDRMEGLRRARELSSDVPPAWFDPMYAGERWSED